LKKLVVIVLALAILSIVLTPSVGASSYNVYVDKRIYNPGERGTIYIVIDNDADEPIEIKNVTIMFSNWLRLTEDGWDEKGNFSIVFDESIAVLSNTTHALDPIEFTVPDDSRAVTSSVYIGLGTSKAISWDWHTVSSATVYLAQPENQILIRDLDNIVMLLTVVAILAIIGAIIIAAAVFLSGRRPGVTWQKEQ